MGICNLAKTNIFIYTAISFMSFAKCTLYTKRLKRLIMIYKGISTEMQTHVAFPWRVTSRINRCVLSDSFRKSNFSRFCFCFSFKKLRGSFDITPLKSRTNSKIWMTIIPSVLKYSRMKPKPNNYLYLKNLTRLS